MVLVHEGLKTELIPAGKVQQGMQIQIVDEIGGECVLTDVTSVSPVAPNTVEGLANILTASETIIVNGVVGSVLSEKTTTRPGRKVLKAVHRVLGTKVARCTYRIMEWILDNNYVSSDTI